MGDADYLMAGEIKMGRPGVLFLIVGPSGVGKDSLIDGARQFLQHDISFWFPTRFITRPADAGGETHQAVTPEAFDRLQNSGAFMLSWHAHGHGYGIPIAVKEALARGRSVIVNVSRQMIDEARRLWSPVRVMLITAPRDILRDRLVKRGRETIDDIEKRLDRVDAYHVDGSDVREVVNAHRLERAIDRFVAMLQYEVMSSIAARQKESECSA
ncbi:MAG: phosphonate metabolism protein/1,5-bisphosphokinase (PRPP-forming) PhnN [Geminicoccales bacterium]